VNIDGSADAVSDIRADFLTVDRLFEPASVSEVMMGHSIGYLRLWQARELFRIFHRIMHPDGLLVIETPDAVKCARLLLEAQDDAAFVEAVRGFYAFDLEQVEKRQLYSPYAFGWTAGLLCRELLQAGFREAVERAPQTHGPRPLRDTRVEATR
jgi:hypothetical protein